MRALDPATLPLSGQILIEASAGTGKTYTIGLLLLRLLLEREIPIDRILVVTYTRAATAELRGRLRNRIRETLQYLDRDQDHDMPPDLAAILERIPDRDQARDLLREALVRMDEAAVYTIHSFCQRMLQEFAFESGLGFSPEFLESEDGLRTWIMEDFWRRTLLDSRGEHARWLLTHWTSPAKLRAEFNGPLGRRQISTVPEIDQEELSCLAQEVQDLFARLRQYWPQQGREIRDLLENSNRLKRDKRKGYSPERLEKGFRALQTLMAAETPPFPLDDTLVLFTATNINASLRKQGRDPKPEHAFFHLFELFWTQQQKLARWQRLRLLNQARCYLFTELDRRKERLGQLAYDDLLFHLDRALAGKTGVQLARRIGRRFPMILIDEFQDTDPLQYRIFSRVHAQAGKGSGLFLIGDPKQAIYGFRGADIFTYLAAKQDTRPENRLTMTRNYRSCPAVVETVNRLFSRENSFLLGPDLSCPPVEAALEEDHQEQLPPPLTWLLFNEPGEGQLPKGTTEKRAGRLCAARIASLLADPPRLGSTPLGGGDIGILVRTNREAELMARALAELDLPCISTSQQSVFTTREADHLALLMTVLLDPDDSGRIKTLLSQPLFGFTASDLDALNQDDRQWEEIMDRIANYGRLWQEQGFLAMFHHLLTREKTVAAIGTRPGGDRMLTNWLHLAELLQEAAGRQPGRSGLLRWHLSRQQSPLDSPESEQLRLENDGDLIQIVTIHKAKGLQYPVVFLPFAWKFRKPRLPMVFHDEGEERQPLVVLDEENREHMHAAIHEHQAEERRLLYVALTRARYAIEICWGLTREMTKSSLAGLLHPTEPKTLDDLLTDLERITPDGHALSLVHWPPEHVGRLRTAVKDAGPRPVAARFRGHIDSSWQVTSYSRLSALADDTDSLPSDPFPAAEEEESRFTFPRGPAPGTCLHAILEHADFTDPEHLAEVTKQWLERSGMEPRWQPTVTGWLNAVLATELWPGFSLNRLTREDRLNEMGFTFPIHRLDTARMDRLLNEAGYPGLPGGRRELHGLLVGYIDLVFRHEGRYWLADYKSNHLGYTAAAYAPEALNRVMRSHRYDLQLLFYTLALYRHLRHRLPDFDYERDFGGGCYLFLRGMDPGDPPGNGVLQHRVEPDLIRSLDRLMRGEP